MDVNIHNPAWEALSHAEKNHQLFLTQKHTLDLFLAPRSRNRSRVCFWTCFWSGAPSPRPSTTRAWATWP